MAGYRTGNRRRAMKGIICYYSATGNTRLVVGHLVRHLQIPFDLCNIARDPLPEFANYAVVGFASPVERMAMPALMRGFLHSLPLSRGKPAFILVTYGAIVGRALADMASALRARSFKLIGAHALPVPDSFPPFIALHLGSSGMPDGAALKAFDGFIANLGTAISDLAEGNSVPEIDVRPDFRNLVASRVLGRPRRRPAPMSVDQSACTKCGDCARCCPYKAVRLDPLPVFDEKQCRGCWACYNLCPERAIHTRWLRGRGHYPGPSQTFKEKMGL